MQRKAPATAEGWYVRHDLRRIDWDAWREASEAVRERAIDEGMGYFESAIAVEDAEVGQSALYAAQGHKADLLVVHLRPTMAALDALERRFETTQFAQFTERASSYVSVTEASGYSEKGQQFIDGDLDDDSGLAKYMRSRLYPEIPEEEFVSFYPMSKRRQPDQNWYDLPFAERAEHIQRHGEIGREYGGKVQQMITGSMGMDDWEWGVTLWASDLTDVKDLLAQMRFDQSTSKFAEFGPFYVGRRFPPSDLEVYLAGEHVPTADAAASGTDASATDDTTETAAAHTSADVHQSGAHDGEVTETETPHDDGDHPVSAGDDGHPGDDGGHAESAADEQGDGGGHRGPPTGGDAEFTEIDDAATRLGMYGVHEGEDYDSGAYALLYHSEADAEDLAEETESLRSDFDHYDRHVLTTTRANRGQTVVISVWTAKEAAEIAAGFLGDLPGISERLAGHLGEPTSDDADGAADEAAGATDDDRAAADSVRAQLADLDVYAGQPHGEDVYALVLYTTAAPEELEAAVASAREDFAGEGHVKTAIYEDPESETTAVVSLWDGPESANAAGERLADLPGIVGRPTDREGFGTMGMFYTVKPEHREEFVETFETVGELLADMDGHRETALLANRGDENDMFIASRWDAREDAMEFFRSDAFADTVEWGRDVLADRPRHVFLA